MPISPQRFLQWSRYGMEPFNWIVPGRLMASVYPRSWEYLGYLREAEGIELAINLAENPWPGEWSEASGVRCHHVPIIDMSVPSKEQVIETIDIISGHDGPVMVHCAAGIGRTGTVIALYLVNQGDPPGDAIAHVRSMRTGSIQTPQQERMIYEWAKRGR